MCLSGRFLLFLKKVSNKIKVVSEMLYLIIKKEQEPKGEKEDETSVIMEEQISKYIYKNISS